MSIRQVKRPSLTLHQQDQLNFFSRTMESFEMIIMSFIVISMITIVASAVVSAYVNVSRERLWVRAAKAEELYMAIEETHTSMTTKVVAALNLPESRFLSAIDLESALQKLCVIKVSVRLYFPEAARELSCLEAAAKSLAAELAGVEGATSRSDYNERLSSFDAALCNFVEALNLIKNKILDLSVIERDWVRFLLHPRAQKQAAPQTYASAHNAAF
jgi:hypothetical protein